uniref:Rho GTPase-activating protein 21 n=1 Tax=Cacopsylla melanoneura TaxID=428564 RepID=A0A8D8UFY2_9HEMI
MADDGAHKAAPRNKKSSQQLGPRSLFLRRSTSLNGFGFTLRHFIVYPPESYTVLAGDRRLGLRSRCIDEPMDTIFIKHVRPHSPASAAGLMPGDRVVSVNGQTIADLPYAEVVQLIQNSPAYLHLLVVPKENDLLQLYFGDTAHNPETNQRPPCPIYQNVWEVEQDQLYSRRASEGSTNCDNFPTAPRSRLSLDAGLSDPPSVTMRSSPTSSDDSLLISRIKRSCEQKEEFLRRPPPATVIQTPPREFYSRAQKLQEPPSWPPTPSPHDTSSSRESSSGSGHKGNKNKQSFVTPLSRIQENNKVPSSSSPSPPSSNSPPNPHPVQQHPANFTIVTTRTKQFESGEVEPDKTDLYRSELSRLSSTQNVPNVAVRRKEFEALSSAQSNSISSSCSSQTSVPSITSPTSTSNYNSHCSGNRIIPVGNSNLHCEPPANYVPTTNEEEQVVRTRPRPSQLSLSPNSNARPAKMRHSDIPADYLDQVPDIHVEELKTPSEKSSHDSTDEEKASRRISYLKANHSDLELSDNEPSPCSRRKSLKKWRPPLFAGDIQRLKRMFEERAFSGDTKRSSCKDVTREGYLQVKVTLVDGKKSSDRSWKQLYAVLIGTTLYLYKERRDFLLAHDEPPASLDKLDMTGSCERIDIGHNCVEVACDYTKRKHVLRLSSPSSNTELLLQADDTLTMAHWIRDLQTHAIAQSASESNISPHQGKSRKLPAASPRKSSATEATLPPSPKSKTWKGRVAKQFRRIQAGAGSPNSPNPPYPPGTNIGVPLQDCLISTFSEFVPLLVELCTNVVESKGLEIIGIYRVPGNTAAVSALTEAVNKGLDSSVLAQDPRWSDVNVISSLLKSFFRRLPDSLLTTELYPAFIQADKIENPVQRMNTIKKLVQELPEHHLETLKYILQHLKRVVDNAEVNKMEARNLAIVFGPTLVRAGGDDMVTMVTDMSHQCRIVETLILNVDWFFDESESLYPGDSVELSTAVDHHGPTNPSLLLNNIHKMEGIQQSVSAKDIVSSILFAANRKINRSVSSSRAFGSQTTQSTTQGHLTTSASTSKITSSLPPPPTSSAPSPTTPPPGSSNEHPTPSCKPPAPSPHSPVAQCISQSVMFSGNIAKKLQGPEEEQEGGGGVSPSGSSGAITSYTGLSATTQERIRRFEQETLAMLHKEYKLNMDKDSKRELEMDDKSIDSLTHSSNELRPSSESVSSNSLNLSRLSSSCATSPSPSLQRSPRSPRLATRSSSATHMKRLKTGKELETETSPASGSTDSLTLQDVTRSQSQHILASDEGSDLLTTLTSTFDQKLKLLLKSESITSSPTEPSESFKDPSLHRTLDNVSNKSSDSESKDKENKSVLSNVQEIKPTNVNVKENNVKSVIVKEIKSISNNNNNNNKSTGYTHV